MKERIKKDFFFILYCFFFVPILLSDLRKPQMGLKLKKVKDYFVPDSYRFNRWIGAYSGSESWGVLPTHFY